MASKKLALVTAIGVGITSSLAAITPANAVSVAGCGEVTNGTLTKEPDFCEATFSTVGVASLILPEGVSDLYGIAVGGGGGAYVDNSGIQHGYSTGYAGNGGESKLFHWTKMTPSSQINIQIGAAGISTTDTVERGGTTSISAVSQAKSVTAFGGFVGNPAAYACVPIPGGELLPPDSFGYSIGTGASGTGIVPNTYYCPASHTLGLNPAQRDSDMFSNLTANYGRGGAVLGLAPNPAQPGEGASILIEPIVVDENDQTNRNNQSRKTLSSSSAQAGIVKIRFTRTIPTTTTTYYSPTFGITFDGNGADNLSDTALSGQLNRAGYRFVGWNTKADGSGSPFVLGKSIPVSGDMKLFAQWVKNPATEKGKQRISTFIGDSASLNSAMKKQISNWIRTVPKDSQILCKGSTSGTRVTTFDKRLARTRAQNACDYAVKVRSDVVFKIGVNPSSSNKVSARNVWMSYIS